MCWFAPCDLGFAQPAQCPALDASAGMALNFRNSTDVLNHAVQLHAESGSDKTMSECPKHGST